jgi:hypothetical protein
MWQIDCEAVELDDRCRIGFWCSRTAELRLHTRHELPETKRLAHVIVSAGVQQSDLLGFGMPRRQHDDRHGRPPAQLAANVDARHVGQTQVEYDEVWFLRCGNLQCLDARRGFHDPRGHGRKRLAQRTSNLRFVVDH